MKKIVVFIRGWASLDESFEDFRKLCPKSYQVKIVSSELLLKDFDIEKAVVRLKKMLDKDHIDQMILAGHSLGGAVALMFAYKYPHRVERLVLLNSEGIKADKIGFNAFVKLVAENVRKPGATLYRKLKEGVEVLKSPVFQYKLGFFAHNLDLSDIAIKISISTLLLWGDKDRLIPYSRGERLHKLIKGSKLIQLKGMDHDWIMHSPQLFWREM